MSWDDTLGNMRTLDRWRDAVGMTYDAERLENLRRPIARRPLRVTPRNRMRYGRIDGLDKPVARLCCGAMIAGSGHREALAIWDDYFERGGNAFDTAWIYRDADTVLGHWLSTRGVREQVVVIAKGAHTPHCDPQSLTAQLYESLDRLKTDYADVYLLHRDNPDVPTGEFIDVLNEHRAAGRIRAIGCSNWSIPRIEAANAYARERGLAGFSIVSNQFSLARMVEPPWKGCVSASDPAARAWHERTRTPLLSWSSQTRGFFTDCSSPQKRDDAELVRCWYSDDNLGRKSRAAALARQRGVDPTAVALAYVLHQSFPTFALIGPQRLSETLSSFAALDVDFAPENLPFLAPESQDT